MQPTGFAKQQPKPLPTPPPSRSFLRTRGGSILAKLAASPADKTTGQLRGGRLYCPVHAVPRPTRSRHEASRKQELSSHYCQCSYCRGSKLKRKLNPEFSANRMNGTFLKCHLPNAEKDCKTRARVNFVRVGQIEEWMEGSKFAKWFPPTRTPIIPWHHNNPITLTENYSLDPISICNFHVHTLTLPLPNKSTTVDIL